MVATRNAIPLLLTLHVSLSLFLSVIFSYPSVRRCARLCFVPVSLCQVTSLILQAISAEAGSVCEAGTLHTHTHAQKDTQIAMIPLSGAVTTSPPPPTPNNHQQRLHLCPSPFINLCHLHTSHVHTRAQSDTYASMRYLQLSLSSSSSSPPLTLSIASSCSVSNLPLIFIPPSLSPPLYCSVSLSLPI